MPTTDFTITGGQYNQLVSGLDTLKSKIAPRLAVLKRLSKPQQLAWLQEDVLLRRTIKLSLSLVDFLDIAELVED